MKKKIFTVLMMLTMVMTFMPNMAFADTDALTNNQATTVLTNTITTNQASILLQAKAVGKHIVQLNWSKTSGATKYVVYGAKCGKNIKKIATVKGNKYTVKKISKKKLKAHKTYKFYVRAYSGNTKLAQSKTLHFITAKTMKKYANVTKVTAKKSISLEVGETANVNAKYSVYKSKKHLSTYHGKAIKYMSSDTAVAAVNTSGKVTAKAEGDAKIYSQDIGGKYYVTSIKVKSNEEPTPTPVEPVEPDKPTPLIKDNRTFKAVYDTNENANILTFYYDEKEHSGEGITVFDDIYTSPTEPLPETENEKAKALGTCWKYNDVRSKAKSVIFDETVKNYHGLTSTSAMFANFSLVNSIEGTEYLDVSKVKDMSFMFYKFSSRLSSANVPNVSKWKTSNVTDMSYMFSDFGLDKTLNSVPDVSKWNTSNVTDMSYMFSNYANKSTALDLVPDVSGWNTKKVVNMSHMFEQYASISEKTLSPPDVSNWATENVEDMSYLFNEYGKLKKIIKAPDVSKWDTRNVKDMSYMFYRYSGKNATLTSAPDVSKWNTKNVENMTSLFAAYASSIKDFNDVPDVSKWDTRNVKDMSYLFFSYAAYSTTITKAPDVSNWDTSNVVRINYIFRDYSVNSTVLNFNLDLSKWDLSSINVELEDPCGGEFARDNNPVDIIWKVIIPAKTGSQNNDSTHWYVGDGTDTTKYIKPAPGKYFSIKQPIANIIPEDGTLPTSNSSEPPTEAWVNSENSNAKCFMKIGTPNQLIFTNGVITYALSLADISVVSDGDNYVYGPITLVMDKGNLISVTFNDVEGEYSALNGSYATNEQTLYEGNIIISWGDTNLSLDKSLLENVPVGSTIKIYYEISEGEYHCMRITTSWWGDNLGDDMVRQFDLPPETPNIFMFEYDQNCANLVDERQNMLFVGYGYTIKKVTYK